MKGIVFFLILLNSALGVCQKAEFFVENELFKFPRTIEGDTLFHDFKVTNKGTDTLVISNYKVACSCTKVDYPTHIAPNESATFHVSFDTHGKYGLQDRTIIFITNSKKGMEKLRFKVVVDSKT